MVEVLSVTQRVVVRQAVKDDIVYDKVLFGSFSGCYPVQCLTSQQQFIDKQLESIPRRDKTPATSA